METQAQAQAQAQAPYPIMDESGKARSWIEAGRGIRVWVSHDIGAGRPDMLTPGDVETSPHWAYPLSASMLLPSADSVTFFHRVMVVQTWTDTPAGWKAAERHCPASETREAPIGTVYTRYTVERIEMESRVKVHMPGTPAHGPIPGTSAYDRPLHTLYLVGIVSWSAIVQKPERPVKG